MSEQDSNKNDHIVYTPLDIFSAGYQLGDLYDAKNGKFLHAGKLFKQADDDVVSSTDISSRNDMANNQVLTGPCFWAKREDVSKYEFILSSTQSQRLDKLDVTANVKASFLGGLVKVEGSAAYAKSDKEDAAKHTMHVIITGKTGTEGVKSSVYGLPATQLLTEVATKGQATHVVTEITKGYSVAISLSVNKSSSTSDEAAKGNLKLVVKALCASGSGSVDYRGVAKEFCDDVSVKVAGDFPLKDTPQNLEELSAFKKTIPRLLEESNGGWGVPKKVFLTPLKYFPALGRDWNISVVNIGTSTLNKLSDLMDDLDDLVMMSEELKTVNVHEKQTAMLWSVRVDAHLRQFQEMVEQQIVDVQERLVPALDMLTKGGDETGILAILADCKEPSSTCLTLCSKGREWLLHVREHIEHLEAQYCAIDTIVSPVESSRLALKWFAPSSTLAVHTQLLKNPHPILVLRIKENSRGAKPFQVGVCKNTDAFAQESTMQSAALTKLKTYASNHTKEAGTEVLTILAYDGDGVRDDDGIPGSTVRQLVDNTLVELPTRPTSPVRTPVPVPCPNIAVPSSWPPSRWVRVSPNGRCRAVQQADGNLVIYEDGVPIWATGMHKRQQVGATIGTCFQTDGNLVQYQRFSSGNQIAIWAVNCHNEGGKQLVMQNDGNLVIYKAGPHSPGNSIWSSGTWYPGGHMRGKTVG